MPYTKVNTPSLYGVCTACLAPDGVLYRVRNADPEYRCPRCARKQALWDAAEEQLALQVEEAVKAWLDVWSNVPGVEYLEELIRNVADQTAEKYIRGELE